MNRSLIRSLPLVLVLVLACLAPQSAFAGFGDLDANFGSNGKYRVPIGPYDEATGVRVQSNGKTLVAMQRWSTDIVRSDSIFRLTKRGQLEKGFGNDGTIDLPAGLDVVAMELLSDGRLAVLEIERFGRDSQPPTRPSQLLVFKPTGRPDTSFGSGGTLTLGTPTAGFYAQSMAIQDGNKILLSGARDGSATTTSLMRLNPDGSVDTSFADSGTATVPGGVASGNTPATRRLAAIGVAPSGEIYLGLDQAEPLAETHDGPVGVVKFSHDGARDNDFGSGGVAKFMVDGSGIVFGVKSISVASNGNLLVVGEGGYLGRGVTAAFRPYLLDAKGIPSARPAPVNPFLVLPVAGGGFAYALYKSIGVLGPDYQPDTRFDSSELAHRFIDTCDRFSYLAVGKDTALTGIVTEDSECDERRPLFVYRLLGSAGGKAAAVARIKNLEWHKRGSKQIWPRKVTGDAGPAKSLKSVQIAIRRLDSKLLSKGRCRWLIDHATRSVLTRARHGKCNAPRFMSAKGLESWSFKFRRPLHSGKYELYVRATTRAGVHTRFDTDPDTFTSFKVR